MGIIVVVLGLIAGGVFFVMSGDDDDEETGGSTTTSEGGSDTSDGPITTGGDDTTGTTGGDDTGDTTGTTRSGDGDELTCQTFTPGDLGDVTADFAAYIYCYTPEEVSEDDSICLAESVIAVVGADEVEAENYEPMSIYGGTSSSQDAEIRSTAFSCTSGTTDSALADEVGGFWPDSWNPGVS